MMWLLYRQYYIEQMFWGREAGQVELWFVFTTCIPFLYPAGRWWGVRGISEFYAFCNTPNFQNLKGVSKNIPK